MENQKPVSSNNFAGHSTSLALWISTDSGGLRKVDS
jgi:hypothetical protein